MRHRDFCRFPIDFSSSRSGCAVALSVKPDVRFTPESGHVQCTRGCPLSAKSGHRDSINHRGREQRLRNGQAERFCGLEIDDQFDFRQ
jgi:hypothetical protein